MLAKIPRISLNRRALENVLQRQENTVLLLPERRRDEGPAAFGLLDEDR